LKNDNKKFEKDDIFLLLGIFMGENKCGSEALCFWALVLGSEKNVIIIMEKYF